LGSPAYSPGELGRVYRPDVVVVELGVNDLRHDATPAEVEESMRGNVEELREATPGSTSSSCTCRWSPSRAPPS
jgi:lysophospholipase L1-like esterase